MKRIITARLLWLLWFAVVCVFIGNWLLPLSTTTTRSAGILLLAVIWCDLIALTWRQRALRYGLLGFTAACAIFLMLPGRDLQKTTLGAFSASALRRSYVSGLQHYNGVTYYWGGESPKGIDCSGLIRRGLIDSLFVKGLQSFDAGVVRYSLWLWWHDCTAKDLGEGHDFTTHLFDVPSINELDHSRVLPGDLAVTSNGLHIMAYLGERLWIEADPSIGSVVTVVSPTNDNGWFAQPMKIVRWNIFH